MTAVLTVTDARDVSRRAQNTDYPFGGDTARFSEVVLTGKLMNGSYEHTVYVTVQYVPDSSDPSPPFALDGNGYHAIPLDPTKEYTVTFDEEA